MSTEPHDEPPVTIKQISDALDERLRLLEEQVAAIIGAARQDLKRLVETATIAAMASTQEARRNRSTTRLAQGNASTRYRDVLRASRFASNAQLATELGLHESVISQYVRGHRQIPRERAEKIQELTRSKDFPKGIEPTKAFWSKGVV
jgi:ribosome-binding protein aMBF1 (putative translation factor)